MQTTGQRFSIWYGPDSHRPTEWVNAIHFYTRPLYRVNYVYSELLALAYFAELARDPAGASARYEQMLANGYDAPPEEILRRRMRLSLDPEALVARAVAIIEERLSDLDELYE